MMVKTKTLWLRINGKTEHFHHPLDRVNSHLGGFLSSYKVHTMSCTGRGFQFQPFLGDYQAFPFVSKSPQNWSALHFSTPWPQKNQIEQIKPT